MSQEQNANVMCNVAPDSKAENTYKFIILLPIPLQNYLWVSRVIFILSQLVPDRKGDWVVSPLPYIYEIIMHLLGSSGNFNSIPDIFKRTFIKIAMALKMSSTKLPNHRGIWPNASTRGGFASRFQPLKKFPLNCSFTFTFLGNSPQSFSFTVPHILGLNISILYEYA